MTDGGGRTPAWVRASLHRPITVLMLLVSLAVVGFLAYRSIPLQLVPAGIVEQSISVRIPVPDSTPTEVMEEVAEPAEELIRTIAGVTTIVSTSSSDSCSIRVGYSASADSDSIYADVRDRMERLLPSLPEGADRYFIFRFNIETDLPIIQMAVTYGDDVVDSDALLENVIRPRLEGIDGIARVEVRGLVVKQVAVELDPQLVEAYALDIRELIDRLRGDNVISPGGIVDEGGRRFLLRLSTRFADFDEIRNYRISDSLTLGDVATVGYDLGLQNFLVRVNGLRCKTLVISKESEANTLDTCANVLAELEKLPNDPRLASFGYFPYFNQGKVIEDSIDNLKNSCAWGGLLAIVVLYLFLRRVKITLLVAAAIPLSLLIAVVVIFFTNGTFNVLSLTGLTLGIGMLIDNAIVISENIFRFRSRGESPRRAAELGVREVGLAVTLATLTTVAVFLPIIFLGGNSNIRVMLAELGLPVCYSVLASLVVAMVFVPLSTTYLRDTDVAHQPGSDGGAGRLHGTYRRILSWTLRHRFAAVVLSLLVLATTQFPIAQLEEKGLNQPKTRSGSLRIECPPQSSLAETDAVMERIREAFEPIRDELHVENLVTWFDRTGGMFMFFMKPEGTTTRASFMEKVKPYVPEIPGVEIQLSDENESGGAEKETWIRARGRDPRILMELLSQTARRLRQEPGVLEILTPEDSSRAEVRVDLQRDRAQRFGVDPSMAANLIAWALRGAPLTDYQDDDAELPFWIRYQGSDMESLGELHRVSVFSSTGESVSLGNLARFGVDKGVPSIRRRGGRVESAMRVVTAAGVSQKKLQIRSHQIFRELDVPDGYELILEESGREMEESLRDLASASMFGLILIFLIMGVLFESFVLPICVIVSIPFLGVGSYWAMYLSGEAMGEVAYIGFVILLGVVVNNAIVLTDTINRFRARPGNSSRGAAILDAGVARLRPILMTACTTVVGLSPLVVLPNPGEGLDYRPLAIIVMGGLTASTFFTLVVVPLVYTLLDDLRSTMSRGLNVMRRPIAREH